VTALLRSACLVTLLFLAACGEDPAVEPADPEDPLAEEPEAEEPAAEEPAAEEPDADGAVVAVASTDLGEVLVDGDGMTLYMFEPDAQGAPTCYDECAEAWPPLLTDGDPAAGDGADSGLLGTAERDDGDTQVTYDGWPLYRWAADSAPGDTTGQGVNDVWWVLAPDGSPVRDGDAGSAADDTDDIGY
jgi:predicted lipoprotein with Yx(FWY)xxD motif